MASCQCGLPVLVLAGKDVVLPLHHQRLQVLPAGAQQNPEVQLGAEDSDVY